MNLFDYFFAIFCISGFTYQFYILFREYLSGKTVVNLKIGHNEDKGLPAITICPGALSLDKLAPISPHLRQVYDNYTHLINESKYYTKLNDQSLANVRAELARRTYYKAVNYVFDLLDEGTMDIGDLFYNYSILSNLASGKPRFKFTIPVESKLKSEHPLLFEEVDGGKLEVIVEPIVSIHIKMVGKTLFKCFTFFSDFDYKWKSINMNSMGIEIRIALDSISYPLAYHPIPLSFHSPNDLPAIVTGTLKPLRNGEVSLIQYSQTKVERLGSGYDTDCREYGHGFEIRTDCLAQCYEKYFNQYCNSTGLAWSSYLIREEVIKRRNHDRSIRRCREFIKYKQDIEVTCSSNCKLDCSTKFYSTNVIKIADIMEERSVILLEHNEMPDILIKYMPELSFISFICNLGGLLGMWLGLSVYNSVNELKLLANNFKMKDQAIKIFNMGFFNCHFHGNSNHTEVQSH